MCVCVYQCGGECVWLFISSGFSFCFLSLVYLSTGLWNVKQHIRGSFLVADSLPKCFAQANIKMNRLPLTTISVIITGSGPESPDNKNRASGEATGLLRTSQ